MLAHFSWLSLSRAWHCLGWVTFIGSTTTRSSLLLGKQHRKYFLSEWFLQNVIHSEWKPYSYAYPTFLGFGYISYPYSRNCVKRLI